MGDNEHNAESGKQWAPTGGKVMEIEFDRHLLSDIRRFAEEDGVNSLYQMIRNICWQYARDRKYGRHRGNTRRGAGDRRELSLYRKRVNFVDGEESK